ncbi:bifunctional aspartokinase/homoserine dehydrogenase II [Nitzschia inconspicua]|uniref:aspartate kinase n=1 Tax=Nitzschia inconspicua TaxID=303405 RepID=A0A9K3M323_9STRA|nr:bifunctional aspartokinase/homoserine dehydrogenase II [Nitzschia inconspicua]
MTATAFSDLGTYDPDQTWTGFADKTWQVHKFGGTSVANADCYRSAAAIVEEQLGIVGNHGDNHNNRTSTEDHHLAVVVSAMGGKPKTTDLLLQSVEAAARRDQPEVENLLQYVLDKHVTCLQNLFPDRDEDQSNLKAIVQKDLEDIQDILKTVSLMKWQATRISELVSGYGELWSARILSKLLQNRSLERYEQELHESSGGDASLHDEEAPLLHHFIFIDARRIIIIDEEAIQDGAVEWDISKKKLQEVYEEETANLKADGRNTKLHFVVTGYVASNTEGVATTLQRDGSDYSAAIMGRLLQSTNITIWTDVDGVLSADPRRVPTAYAVPEVSYNEAMELAYFGAKVIHPKTMQPAISSNPQIPIFIRNTFNPKFRGTRIYTSSVTTTQSDSCVCGFSSIDRMALINVEGSGLIGVQGVARRLFGTLESLGINVVLISQASSEHSITFATSEDHAQAAKEAIEEEFHKELNQNRISNIDVNSPCSIIAAVGDGMKDVTGVSGRFFSAVGDAQINIYAIAQGCSERNISAVVATAQSTRALRALHAAFRLSHTTVRVGVVGVNELGESLLRLLETQRRHLWDAFEIDLQVCTVAMDSHDTDIFRLKNENGDESITLTAIRNAMKAPSEKSESKISFKDSATGEVIKSSHGDLGPLRDNLFRVDCAHHVVFDCTNDPEASMFHAQWLSSDVHVVTANVTGISGDKTVWDAIHAAETARGKLSAQYLREVTVCGGLPVISTIRTLLTSGDKIRRVDGIMSVAMSYIMFRVSPPPEIARNGKFDQKCTNGAFHGDIGKSEDFGKQVLFSQAVKEAVAMGLTEKDISLDLSNEYGACVLMVLAKELGLDRNLTRDEIQQHSETLMDIPQGQALDHQYFEGAIDEKIQARVTAAAERGCVLRHVGSVDVASQSVGIKIVEVPNSHVFATTPPSCECVRFFTHRHQPYPLVIQGPAAGADCTSSALLAELLRMMRSKVGPRFGILARTNSSTYLK